MLPADERRLVTNRLKSEDNFRIVTINSSALSVFMNWTRDVQRTIAMHGYHGPFALI